MHAAIQIQREGKRGRPSLMAASDDLTPRRLFVTDAKTQTRYLVDTGSDISVYPRSKINYRVKATEYALYAANGTTIATYGNTNLQPDFGLRRDLQWRFIIADVTYPIIGADFLSFYHLVPDLRKGKLIDGETELEAKGRIETAMVETIKTIHGESCYHQILRKFPKVNGEQQRKEHGTEHHIRTTQGPPMACRPRRLAPDKLKIAKLEFDLLLREGIIQPSKSPWSSPLHMVPKQANAWRPCGNYRKLNERTMPDRYLIPHIEDFAQSLQRAKVFSTLDLV